MRSKANFKYPHSIGYYLRAVTTATAAAVLGVERKTLDNLILRLGEEFIPRGRQGVDRRIPVATLADLLLVMELIESLQVPARRALELVRNPGALPDSGSDFLALEVRRDRAEREIELRLSHAIESVVRPRRGRPQRAL
jgi:hypothetical protein